MNIAFFGSSLVSAYWNGAATYYRGIIRSLNQLGHRVTFYEPDAYERQSHRDLPDPDWAEVVVYQPDEQSAMRCLESASRADVVVKASGVGVNDEILEREVLDLRSEKTGVIFWDVDAPATIERVKSNPGDPFAPLIGRYDMVLTYGGGPLVVKAYRELGARECFPIYNALDPVTHFPVRPDPRFKGDLAFLGNRLPDREARVEEFFLRPAELLPHARFVFGGSGWDDKPLPENVRRLGHVFTVDHNAMNCSAKAVLNICRDSMARFGYSPATRVFEAAGAGACLITDWFEGMELFLEPDKEVLIARDGEEVALLLDRLPPRRAKQIGAAARRRILDHHTYSSRAQDVHRLLGNRLERTAA